MNVLYVITNGNDDEWWVAACDATCPVCRYRNISPFESENITRDMYQLRWEVIDETNTEVETILAVYPIAEFDTRHSASDVKRFMEWYDAKCPYNFNAKLRINEV